MIVSFSEAALKKRGAFADGNYLRVPVSELLDPERPESSNNGNYRDYREFLFDTHGFYTRESASFHGDIEPFPSWERVSEETWIKLVLEAMLAE